MIIIAALLLGLLAGTLAAPAALAQSKEPILIGVSGPLTGQYAQYGAQWKKGFDLALDEINGGGRHQRTAARNMCSRTRQSDPRQTVTIAQQIRRRRAHRGRGRRFLQRRPRWRPRRSTRRPAWCSSASPTRTRISPRAATSCGATPSTRRTSMPLLRGFRARLGLKRIAVLHLNSDWGRTAKDLLVEAVEGARRRGGRQPKAIWRTRRTSAPPSCGCAAPIRTRSR